MASRSRDRANAAIAELERETGFTAIFLQLDLADLGSVKTAALEFMQKEEHLHVLFNSGRVTNIIIPPNREADPDSLHRGVMANPIDELTKDGYDVQFGTVSHLVL